MALSGILPHVYYTITELSSVKDIKMLKNVNVKTIGYVHEDHAYEIDFKKRAFEKGAANVKLDISHVNVKNICGIKPYIMFGILFSLNQSPAISVKTLKQFDGDFDNLVTYQHQLLEIRKKNKFFENLGEEN